MKEEYSEISEFLDDVHEQISLRNTVVKMGLIKEDDIKSNGFTNCIFHSGDNTPSLQLTDNFFKCYACPAKGDLVKFIMLYYNMDFIEAVKKLAEFLDINIKTIKYNFDSKSNKLRAEWDKYLENMNNADKSIQELKRDYFPQEIGYDPAIEYVVLPITSKSGAILGFTKRRIDFKHKELGYGEINESTGEFSFKKPKWRHSSIKDSLIANCHNIFNFFEANKEIHKIGEVILTEGPKDVIGYRRINKNNTICCCGTQNSSNIWDLIFPVDEIVLSFDGDAAGIKATIKTILYLAPIFDIQHITSTELPDGEDPYSVNNLKDYYNNKINSVDFYIKHATRAQILDLYRAVPNYNKTFIIKEICLIKDYSVEEAESWLRHKDMEKEGSELSEKDILLSIVNCEDKDLPYFVPIDKAKKILKLKYGIDS